MTRNNTMPVMKPVEPGRHIAPEYGEGAVRIDIRTEEWTHVCCARFGEPRVAFRDKEGNPMTNWSGDSFRYDIFRKDGHIALRWWNGSGEGWLISRLNDRRDESNLLDVISTWFVESQRWDACHFLWAASFKSHYAGWRDERMRVHTAFAEGRLKKRRRNGSTYIEEVCAQ